MVNAILGIKLGQSQQFDSSGRRIPVTTIVAGPCWVTKINSNDYQSLQLGFGSRKHQTKALAGHTKKAGIEQTPRFFREIRMPQGQVCAVGDKIAVGDVFAPGDPVRVTGTSKGKGFAGVVKRHGFHGGPRTHGQSDRERAPGAVGSGTTPGRVYKGKRMAGRMGSDKVTVKGLRVVAINPENNLLTIKGLVPGASKGLLLIQKE